MSAQKYSGIVVDMESRRPLSGVKIKTSDGQTVFTSYDGRFTLKWGFRSAVFMSLGYLTRNADLSELTDTVRLLPNMLDEVVVTARSPFRPTFTLPRQSTADHSSGARRPSGHDLLGWLRVFEKGHRPSAEEQRKNKQIWDNY